MVGLESDDDEKSYMPAHISPTSNKRKRVTKSRMSTDQDHKMTIEGAGHEPATIVSSSLYDGSGYGYVYDAPAPFAGWGASPFGGLYDASFGQSNLINHSSYEDVGGSFPPHPSYVSGAYGDIFNSHGSLPDAPEAPDALANFEQPEADAMAEAHVIPVTDVMPDMVIEAAQSASDDAYVKEEATEENLVSSTPLGDSEYSESDYDERRPPKVPKLNKDGVPRKPRQPRPKLLKWDDNDWKNVALGLVWACGENGLQIPFDQASQVVSKSCTAGALQQALLKLRGKQINEGFQIPSLRMAWTRKNKNASSSSTNTNSSKTQEIALATPKKNCTRFAGNQSLIVTLRRAYIEADRHTAKRKDAMASLCAATPAASPLLPSLQFGYDIPVYTPTTPTTPRFTESGLPFTPQTSPTRFRPQLPPSGSLLEAEIVDNMVQDNAYLINPIRGSNDLSSNRFTTLAEHDGDWVVNSPPKRVRFDTPPTRSGHRGQSDPMSPTPIGRTTNRERFTTALKVVGRKLKYNGGCDDKGSNFVRKRQDHDGHGDRSGGFGQSSGADQYPAAVFGGGFSGGIYPSI
jgi:hypothetical protein